MPIPEGGRGNTQHSRGHPGTDVERLVDTKIGPDPLEFGEQGVHRGFGGDLGEHRHHHVLSRYSRIAATRLGERPAQIPFGGHGAHGRERHSGMEGIPHRQHDLMPDKGEGLRQWHQGIQVPVGRQRGKDNAHDATVDTR